MASSEKFDLFELLKEFVTRSVEAQRAKARADQSLREVYAAMERDHNCGTGQDAEVVDETSH